MAAQEIVSFGYGSQSRETMEVGYSAKSECYGAFERRRETSTMEEKKRAFIAVSYTHLTLPTLVGV